MPNFNKKGQTSETATGTNNVTALRIARFLFTAGIGFLMLINVQPWLELSKAIAKQITTIPFLDSLIAIPLLGGWVEWLFANIVPIFGCVLWAIVQLIEVMPILTETSVPETLRERLESYRWVAYTIETIVCFLRYPPYVGGINAILEDAPNWDASLIDWWNLVFFLVTMFGFELCFRVVITVWQGVKFVKPIAN
ncbi:hypothetical protein H6F96_19645 [Microcoleus sp. FACHB-53]|nr:hypothetical protein [Microcoleus sp. FACHB-53]